MDCFRLKVTLSDGRRLYVTGTGLHRIQTEGVTRKALCHAALKFGYTYNLRMFARLDVFDSLSLPCLPVVAAVTEEDELPIDEEAYVFGGRFVTEAHFSAN